MDYVAYSVDMCRPEQYAEYSILYTVEMMLTDSFNVAVSIFVDESMSILASTQFTYSS